jgi:hypothetical protein
VTDGAKAPGSAATREQMARYLFIVSQQHQYLYELLVERFAGDPNVEVILDRRSRRGRGREMRPEPRSAIVERRSRPEIDEELRIRSHAIVTLSE